MDAPLPGEPGNQSGDASGAADCDATEALGTEPEEPIPDDEYKPL